MSGRKVAQSTSSSVISSRPRAGSLVRPCITWTKPAVVGVAGLVDVDPRAVVELGLAVEARGHPLPPRTLLGPVAVAPGGLLGVEAHQRHHAAVGRHAPRAAEPARRAGGQVGLPLLQLGLRRLHVPDPPLDHLHEHARPPLVTRSRLLIAAFDATPRTGVRRGVCADQARGFGRARRCVRSPCLPNRLRNSTASPSAGPNQCGVRVSNSAASPGSSTRSWSASSSRSRPSST